MNELNKSLSRDDLFLLMKTYENSVILNTTLLEQQKTLIDKQNILCDKQIETFSTVTKVLDNLKNHTTEVIKTENSIVDRLEQVSKDIIISSKEQTTLLGQMKDNCSKSHTLINSETVNLSKEHMGINTKVYISYAGLITIILSLIVLIDKLFLKFETINAIAKSLGVI